MYRFNIRTFLSITSSTGRLLLSRVAASFAPSPPTADETVLKDAGALAAGFVIPAVIT
jgi:hypothetical protein